MTGNLSAGKIGLYYPFIEIREESWIKVAALYWPAMARICPKDYSATDSDTIRELSEGLDFLISVRPDAAIAPTVEVFKDVINEHGERLRSLYGITSDELRNEPGRRNWNPPHDIGTHIPARWHSLDFPRNIHNPLLPLTSRDAQQCKISALHEGSMNDELIDIMVQRGLAVHSPSTSPWVAMHPDIAWLYKCVMARILGSQNQLVPVTDQTAAYSALYPWGADKVAEALLDDPPAGVYDLSEILGLMAVFLVVPANIDQVPARKVVIIRQRYAAELDAFRDEVASMSRELSDQLSMISDPAVFEAYLKQAVRRRFEQPLKDLKKAMRSLGVETAYATVGTKFELPAAAAAASGALVGGYPWLAGAGALAFGLLSLRHNAARARENELQPSNATYLLRVERELAPKSLVGRIASSITKTAGLGS